MRNVSLDKLKHLRAHLKVLMCCLIIMGTLSVESRKRIITLHLNGYSVTNIRQGLKDENIVISHQVIYNIVNKFWNHRMYKDLPVQCRRQKITEEMKVMIEEAINTNDEITATEIKS